VIQQDENVGSQIRRSGVNPIAQFKDKESFGWDFED